MAHSLGTLVAYDLLVRGPQAADWEFPSLMAVGSPLGVQAIVDPLRPISHPDSVGPWFNAYDPQDTVALDPLGSGHFAITSRCRIR